MFARLFKTDAKPIPLHNINVVDAGIASVSYHQATVTPDSLFSQLNCPYCLQAIDDDNKVVCDSCAIQFSSSITKDPAIMNESSHIHVSSNMITNRNALLTLRLEHENNHVDETSIVVTVDDHFQRKLNDLLASGDHNSQPVHIPASKNVMVSTAEASYVENTANSSAFGGERLIPNIDNSIARQQIAAENKVDIQVIPGRRQIPSIDRISMQSRNQQFMDSSGSRVNQPSHIRSYDLGGYERSVLIDPNRHLNVDINTQPIASDTSSIDLSSMALPLEVAVVGAKIRNIHRTGGERVKEMDHFVAVVETPVVKLQLDDGQIFENRTAIGFILQHSAQKSMLVASMSIQLPTFGTNDNNTVDSILVNNDYLSSLSDASYDGVLRYASIFRWLLRLIYINIFELPFNNDSIQMYYMATVRANEFICSFDTSSSNTNRMPKLFINILPFQQAICCNIENNDMNHPIDIKEDMLAELVSYWVTRISLTFRQVSSSYPINTQYHELSVGLYSKSIRSKMTAALASVVSKSHDMTPLQIHSRLH